MDGDPEKLNLRLPKGLYDHLADEGEANETSMNTFLVTVAPCRTSHFPTRCLRPSLLTYPLRVSRNGVDSRVRADSRWPFRRRGQGPR